MAFAPQNNNSWIVDAFNKNKAAATPETPAALPSYLGGGQSMAYPQAMPGQMEAIAAQLSAGFGQPASAYMQQMDTLYNPVNVGPQPAAASPAGDLQSLYNQEKAAGRTVLDFGRWSSEHQKALAGGAAPKPQGGMSQQLGNMFKPSGLTATNPLGMQARTINTGGSR